MERYKNYQKEQRKWIIIIVAVVAVLIIGVLIWWFFLRSKPTATIDINLNTNTTVTVNTNVEVVNASVEPPPRNINLEERDDQLALIRFANLFTERLGSYSTDSDFQNIIDLKVYMTQKMQSWADSYVKIQRSKISDTGYSSVVTKVISTKVVSQDAVKSEVNLSTQRTEEGINRTENNSYYQDINLKLVKKDDQWLVDIATWQDVE